MLLTRWICYVLALWKLSLQLTFFCTAKIILLYPEPLQLINDINDAIMPLNESDLLHAILYGNKNFDNMNISILTAKTLKGLIKLLDFSPYCLQMISKVSFLYCFVLHIYLFYFNVYLLICKIRSSLL